jgi:hypothetical protein
MPIDTVPVLLKMIPHMLEEGDQAISELIVQ